MAGVKMQTYVDQSSVDVKPCTHRFWNNQNVCA